MICGDVDLEDESFLSQVAAVEAAALSATSGPNSIAKRRRISDAGVTMATKSEIKPANDTLEGAYLAALRGSKSLAFQQLQEEQRSIYAPLSRSNTTRGLDTSGRASGDGVGGGSCFRCGKPGHWSRDCDANASFRTANDDESGVAPMKCPCGLGDCIVLTANTEKNRGRKFYRCPLRQDNGGCGFFDWCDKPHEINGITARSLSSAQNSAFPELSCPCGAGSCLILTAKTGKNIGQQFYRCPTTQGSCGFFKWCNEQITATRHSPTSYLRKDQTSMISGTYSSGNSSCFKCGKDGHWAKDCPLPSMKSIDDGQLKSSTSGTCFKCNRPGHWAKDCSSVADARLSFKH